ncbi:hypothetical protein Mal4_40100 [Maioricimonas rarisocia]|uniref:Uncharacterized protein n=1 Tax=Maioricimonas rarisocia TaxID=2528026 RepID=A0A517ZAZ5_9PLAN|nr:hypothetical protein [Maioricimonas rarisocia]QDU39664.1 hypothetical protein Mal4_40100 [Maioricimonas rarisocia]
MTDRPRTLAPSAYERTRKAVLETESVRHGARAPQQTPRDNQHARRMRVAVGLGEVDATGVVRSISSTNRAFHNGEVLPAKPLVWDPQSRQWIVADPDEEIALLVGAGGQLSVSPNSDVTCVHVPGVGNVVVQSELMALFQTTDANQPADAGPPAFGIAAVSQATGQNVSSDDVFAAGTGQIAIVRPPVNAHEQDYVFLGATPRRRETSRNDSGGNPSLAWVVPVTQHLPTWVAYDPEAEAPPQRREIWGPRPGSWYVHKRPTFTRTVEFPHRISVAVECDVDVQLTSNGYGDCTCDASATSNCQATATVEPFEEEVVYGWRVIDVDEQQGLCLVGHVTSFLSETVRRDGSVDDFDHTESS